MYIGFHSYPILH